jgi:tetratricopeptide (TPR) repeat protein
MAAMMNAAGRMMTRNGRLWLLPAVLAGALALYPAHDAMAAMNDGSGAGDELEDAYYLAGRAAFEAKDWEAVIGHMTRAIERRPWHDDAYSLMGFAYRKLGDFDRSLTSYDKAFSLNPHNRGALEYLGEAYLELDQPERASEMLKRLATACARVSQNAAGNDEAAGCEEWEDLNAAFEAYKKGEPLPKHE